MKKNNIKYFLAANSCEGFVSYFSNCYNCKDGWKAYIIKGGPGTGKSSFMKFLVAKASEKNIKAELCPCSSDPDSLDAVIFPDKKVVILDGTAPHTLDPSYAGVCEEILNFGMFWKTEKLQEKKAEIIELTDKNKALHKSAALYLGALREILMDNLKIMSLCTEKSKTEAFANRLCKKYIPKKSGFGKEQIRFLFGATPKGVVSFADTVLSLAEKTIIIEDEYGFTSNIIMKNLRDYSLKNGYEIITVKNALLPSCLYDHIIIPELSLAFVREFSFQHFKTEERRIHSRRFINTTLFSKNRQKLRFNKKISKELLNEVLLNIHKAKLCHDELEKYYIEAMNFNSLTLFAQTMADKILEND